MSAEQQAAYINSQVACAMIELESMKAANSQRDADKPLYTMADFLALIEKYGIHHNAVMGWMS